MGQICAFRPIREFLPRKPSLLSFACADRWTTSVSRALAHAIDAWDPRSSLSLALDTSVWATLVRSSVLLGCELETEPRALASPFCYLERGPALSDVVCSSLRSSCRRSRRAPGIPVPQTPACSLTLSGGAISSDPSLCSDSVAQRCQRHIRGIRVNQRRIWGRSNGISMLASRDPWRFSLHPLDSLRGI